MMTELRKLIGLVLYIFKGSLYTILRIKDYSDELTSIFLISQYSQTKIPTQKVSFNSEKVEIFPEGSLKKRKTLLTLREQCVLAYLCRSRKISKVFEFGVYKGGSFRIFNENIDSLTYYGIDHGERMEFEEIRNLGGIVLQQDSQDFEPQSIEQKFDLVFIDGGHSFDTVRNDTRKAFELLADGGIIIWDDYIPSQSGVYRYLNEFHKQNPLIHIEGTSFVIYGIEKFS